MKELRGEEMLGREYWVGGYVRLEEEGGEKEELLRRGNMGAFG